MWLLAPSDLFLEQVDSIQRAKHSILEQRVCYCGQQAVCALVHWWQSILFPSHTRCVVTRSIYFSKEQDSRHFPFLEIWQYSHNRNCCLPVLQAGGWDPGVGRAGSPWGLPPGRADGRHPPVSSHRRPSGCVCPHLLFLWGSQSCETRATLGTPFSMHHFWRDPFPNAAPSWGHGGQGFNMHFFRGMKFSPKLQDLRKD